MIRLRSGMHVNVYGTGTPFSLVTKDFDGDHCIVDWVNEDDLDDQWIKVRKFSGESTTYRVHAMQCAPRSLS